jgi:hypothetical protein
VVISGHQSPSEVIRGGSMPRAAHMSMTLNGPQPPMSEYELPYLGTHSTRRLQDGRARN